MVNDGIASNTLNSSEYVYDYFLKDHLGNIRVVLTNAERPTVGMALVFDISGFTNFFITRAVQDFQSCFS